MATGDAGDVDLISSEGFLLHSFDIGTEVGAGAGVGVGWETGEATVKTKTNNHRQTRPEGTVA